MFKLLPQNKEFPKSFPLELFNILVLLVEQAKRVIFEFTQRQRFVCSLRVDLLVQVVLSIVHRLHDILLPGDPSLNLDIEAVLQLYTLVVS